MDSLFQLEIASYLCTIPAVIMCFLPMHNQLKYGAARTFITFTLLAVIIIPGAAWLNIQYNLDQNALTAPIVLLFFIVYHLHLKNSLGASVAIVSFVCALMSILSNYANAYDAWLRPDAAANTFSMQAAMFQFVLCAGVLVILSWFLWSFGSELVDNLDNDSVWYTTALSSLVFVSLNIALYPGDYKLLTTGGNFAAFLVELSLLLLLLLISSIMFYYTVSEILDKHRIEERNRMLEVQESQYKNTQSYLEATTRARHDFRQAIRTLKELSDQGEYEKLSEYLNSYIEAMPSNTVVKYCQNNAVNALLNFYTRDAKQLNVDLNLSADLPEQLSVTDIDLCSMLGNIMENAMNAAKNAPEGKRWIDLVVTTQHEQQLLIVASNGMAGDIKMRDGEYLSTTHRGSGLGLRSIREIAERNGGVAEFSHVDGEFHTDVMIPLS